MIKSACLAVPVLCSVLLASGAAVAQESGYYVRITPGFAWTTVEHIKRVSVGQRYSLSTSSSTEPELAIHLAGGFRGQPGRAWFLDFEVEGIVYAPRSIGADIQPTSTGEPHDIRPGSWEFTNNSGMGANVVLERVLGRSNRRILFFAGVHRMATEVASGETHPGTGLFAEDREIRTRWPFTGGGGAAFGPFQVRVSYFRSLVYWGLHSPEIEIDYEWRASGLSVNLGLEAF